MVTRMSQRVARAGAAFSITPASNAPSDIAAPRARHWRGSSEGQVSTGQFFAPANHLTERAIVFSVNHRGKQGPVRSCGFRAGRAFVCKARKQDFMHDEMQKPQSLQAAETLR